MNIAHHFIVLTLAVLIWLVLRTFQPSWGNVVYTAFVGANFALYGAIHALAVVLALDSRPVCRAFVFVLLTALASYFVPRLALVATDYLDLGAFAFASAIGALVYSLLVSCFWLPRLMFSLVLMSVPLCASVTVMVVLLLALVSQVAQGYFLFTVAWWYTFSMSLWFSHRLSANKSFKADAVNGAA